MTNDDDDAAGAAGAAGVPCIMLFGMHGLWFLRRS